VNQLPDVCHARGSIVWLRVISSLAWLDSALVGKDAKLSYAFVSGVELAKRTGETFVFTAVTPGVSAPFAKRGTASRGNLCDTHWVW
jgi:hypothetical protein